MKLTNQNDKRTYRQFKVSVCRWSMLHTPAFGLRERKRQFKIENDLIVDENENSIRRSMSNPYACDFNRRVSPRKQLLAAMNCSKHGPFRLVLINDVLAGDRPARVKCVWQDNMEDSSTRCPNYADIICSSCGTKWCLDMFKGQRSRLGTSHAAASHQPQWFHLSGPRIYLL